MLYYGFPMEFEVALMKSKNLVREVLRISWPMVISELGDSLYSIIDTYFVSKLGTVALAGVGVGSYLSWLFFVVVLLFTIGLLIYVAQSYGAKNFTQARKAIGGTLLYSIIIISPISLIAYYNAKCVVEVIAGPNLEVVDTSAVYFSTRILGLPLLAAAMSMDSSLRAIGATKYSMIAVLSSIFLNIILDPVFIFGLFGFPKMGVKGAALATVLSVAYLVPLEYVFLKRVGLTPIFNLRREYIIKILRLSAPTSIERAVFAIGNNAYIAFIARCSEAALAAHQIGVRVESFIYMPGFAFMVAASSLVGQRIGSGNINEAKKIGWEATKVALILMTLLGIVAAVLSRYLVAPFSPSEEVASLASIYLILAGLSEPGLALAMTLSGSIRGGGNTLVPLIINAGGLYLFRVIPAAIMVKAFGVIGAWIAMFLDVYLRGAIFVYTYKRSFTSLVKKVI